MTHWLTVVVVAARSRRTLGPRLLFGLSTTHFAAGLHRKQKQLQRQRRQPCASRRAQNAATRPWTRLSRILTKSYLEAFPESTTGPTIPSNVNEIRITRSGAVHSAAYHLAPTLHLPRVCSGWSSLHDGCAYNQRWLGGQECRTAAPDRPCPLQALRQILRLHDFRRHFAAVQLPSHSRLHKPLRSSSCWSRCALQLGLGWVQVAPCLAGLRYARCLHYGL